MNKTLQFLYLYFLDRYRLFNCNRIRCDVTAKYYASSYIQVYGSDTAKEELKYW